ncbi:MULTISPECIES: DUF4123 domain-containing protein [unclassified Variovorax]|uniref:DUF4123 domain-containing protein n=1 Tax=unclassified Variovorax TaxID=663243 RepID=UPI00210CF5AA|nr:MULTISPECIES: DUF4123 domain-containing protein [unclassified Variovorax]
MESSITVEAVARHISHELHRQLGLPHAPNCFLILDSVLRPITDADAIASDYLEHSQTPVRLEPNVDPTHWPVLVGFDTGRFAGSELLAHSVAEACEELQADALQSGAGRRIGGWLTSDSSATQVARHLRNAMLQHRPGVGSIWLRIHDPAVLWWLWKFLSPEQRRALLGPIDTFWILDPIGRLTPIRTDTTVPAGDAGQLTLTDALWRDVDSIAPLNLALREWTQAHTSGERFESIFAGALAAVRRAMATGFSSVSDLASYAHCAFAVHPSFDSHPDIERLLEQRESGDYFTQLIDCVSTESWIRIARECAANDVLASDYTAGWPNTVKEM